MGMGHANAASAEPVDRTAAGRGATPRLPISLLSRVDVATPCKADWESMSGDDKKRFCSLCKLHVHNLSAMSEAEAEAFVRQAEVERAGGGRVCVRFYRRADGTVLTQDCPVGVAARVRRRVVAVRGAMVALVAMIGEGIIGCRSSSQNGSTSMAQEEPFSYVRRVLRGSPPVPPVPPAPPAVQGLHMVIGDFLPQMVKPLPPVPFMQAEPTTPAQPTLWYQQPKPEPSPLGVPGESGVMP